MWHFDVETNVVVVVVVVFFFFFGGGNLKQATNYLGLFLILL